MTRWDRAVCVASWTGLAVAKAIGGEGSSHRSSRPEVPAYLEMYAREGDVVIMSGRGNVYCAGLGRPAGATTRNTGANCACAIAARGVEQTLQVRKRFAREGWG